MQICENKQNRIKTNVKSGSHNQNLQLSIKNIPLARTKNKKNLENCEI